MHIIITSYFKALRVEIDHSDYYADTSTRMQF